MLVNKQDTRPLVRWWWLSGPFQESDIRSQLCWALDHGFGGVELAWIDPSWLDEPERSAPRPLFLSDSWSHLVTFAKQEAQALGLRCDFTFGSAWPFGGSWLTTEDAAQTFTGPSRQRLGGCWESESPASREILVLDHLSSKALEHYSKTLLNALAPALSGQPSSLFCDSLELETAELWSPRLWDEFANQFGYRLEPVAATLDNHPDTRYDYRKLRGEVIVREFYTAFTALCHRHKVSSRVQCHGAPADLLAAYAAVDIPESEALLFLPPFSRIAASAAAWTGSEIVSAEAFTCLYGFPGWDDSADELWQEETAGDLKLLADALFANGINQLVWHGMPYRPHGGEQEFYAAVHVGPDSPFEPFLSGLNQYFTAVCLAMREGTTFGGMGVYLPTEDAWMRDRIDPKERTPGANFDWEMRQAHQPAETRGFAPLWISLPFLREARWEDRSIVSRQITLAALFIDCEWLDREALTELDRLVSQGAPVHFSRRPRQPGSHREAGYEMMLDRVLGLQTDLQHLTPLLIGEDLPIYWARQLAGELVLFFAHPHCSKITYPLQYRLSEAALYENRFATLHWHSREIPLNLAFAPNDGLLLRISPSGIVQQGNLPRARDLGA